MIYKYYLLKKKSCTCLSGKHGKGYKLVSRALPSFNMPKSVKSNVVTRKEPVRKLLRLLEVIFYNTQYFPKSKCQAYKEHAIIMIIKDAQMMQGGCQIV